MESHDIRRKLQIIAFELTTPLVSLSGFYNLAKNRTKSQSTINHLKAIIDSVDKIMYKKDLIIEKTRKETDPDFASSERAIKYLHKLATELQEHEILITSSVWQLIDTKWEDNDPKFSDWATNISTKAAENLRIKLEALRTIQPDLGMVIRKSRGK